MVYQFGLPNICIFVGLPIVLLIFRQLGKIKMVKTYNLNVLNFFLPFLFVMVQYSYAQGFDKIELKNTYPWCIVAYDSLERSPKQRIALLKEIGFNKYAYDWRDKHLDDTHAELKLATENNIEIVSVWLWLNAKRDSLNSLSDANQRILGIIDSLNLKTTLWVSLSENFFEEPAYEQSLSKAVKIVDFIAIKAAELDCKVALYNHSGWFGNPFNQLEVIKALPQHELGIVYNFHHAHGSIDNIPQIANAITPYLKAVNLNGMKKDGDKILPIGKGDYEKEMIRTFIKSGFMGPWGILGHVENKDVKKVLLENIDGLISLQVQ